MAGGNGLWAGSAAAVAVLALWGGIMLRPVTPAPQPLVSVAEDAIPAPEPAPLASPTVTPAFDTVRVESGATSVIAGRAAPGVTVAILLDDAEVARAVADAGGSFVALLDIAGAAGARSLTLIADPDGAAIPSEATVLLAPTSETVPFAVAETAPAAEVIPADAAPAPEPVEPVTIATVAETPLPSPPQADSAAPEAASLPTAPDAPPVTVVANPVALATTEAAPVTAVTAADTPAPSLAPMPVTDLADIAVGNPSSPESPLETPRATPPAAAIAALPAPQTPGAPESRVDAAVADLPTMPAALAAPVAAPLAVSPDVPGAAPQVLASASIAPPPQDLAPVAPATVESLPADAPQPVPLAGDAAPVLSALAGTEAPPATPDADLVARPPVLMADASGVRVLQPAIAPGAAPEVLATVALDAISYNDAGEVFLAGRARLPGGGFVRVYVDNTPVAVSPVAADGTWDSGLPDVPPGVYTLRVDQVDATGAVTSRIESPFQREAPAALAAAMAEQTGAGFGGVAVKTVQPGHTLWAIARERYGDGIMYVNVYAANRDRIRNPDLIYPGQVFVLPEMAAEAAP